MIARGLRLRSTGCQPIISSSLPETSSRATHPMLRIASGAQRWSRQAAATGRLGACAPQIIALVLGLATSAFCATLQERIDTAAPNETIHLEVGVHSGAVLIDKPLTLIGGAGAEIRGLGLGNTITIAADDVTVRDLRITGSGLNLSETMQPSSLLAIAPRLSTTLSPIHSTAFTSRKLPARASSITASKGKRPSLPRLSRSRKALAKAPRIAIPP